MLAFLSPVSPRFFRLAWPWGGRGNNLPPPNNYLAQIMKRCPAGFASSPRHNPAEHRPQHPASGLRQPRWVLPSPGKSYFVHFWVFWGLEIALLPACFGRGFAPGGGWGDAVVPTCRTGLAAPLFFWSFLAEPCTLGGGETFGGSGRGCCCSRCLCRGRGAHRARAEHRIQGSRSPGLAFAPFATIDNAAGASP